VSIPELANLFVRLRVRNGAFISWHVLSDLFYFGRQLVQNQLANIKLGACFIDVYTDEIPIFVIV